MNAIKHNAFVAALLTSLAACGGGGGSESEAFVVRTSRFAAGATTPFSADGYQFAYLANEATSGATDLNSDADTLDDVAVVVDARTRVETSTGIAARSVALLGDELYLAVVESADGFDWNGDAALDDVVLLHWEGLSRSATAVATLQSSGKDMLVAGGRLWFVATAGTQGIVADGLHRLDELEPTPVVVALGGTLAAADEPDLLGTQAGCLFLGLDEATEGADLNGDGDQTDASVLALVDAAEATPLVRSTALAMPDDSAPVAARAVSGALAEVAFLVSESAQGATNFNNQTEAELGSAWQEDQCDASHRDTDTNDAVAHYIRWPQWIAGEAARNTGLPGDDVVVLVDGYVAVDCDETAHGGCDLNVDGDASDTIARWTQLVGPATAIDPHSAPLDMHAVADVPGGTHGIVGFAGRLVIGYDEAQDGKPDIDGNGVDTDVLVAWLDPTPTGGTFTFQHGSSTLNEVGVSWMAPSSDNSRLCVALTERVAGDVINDQPEQEGPSGDLDDSIPTWAYFSGTTLIFPGVAIAVRKNDAGITAARGSGFYRVDEAADSFDWNGDGDQADVVVRQTNLSLGTSIGMGTGSAVAGAPGAEFGAAPSGPSVGMFLTDEAMANVDLNGDGDTADKVVRWFRFD